MIVIIGASASGKTEIAKLLQNNYKYQKCITTTTRDKRHNEVDNIDYHFISKEEFKNKLENNEFVEHTLYNDNYYGINKKDVNENSLVIVDPNGANELIKQLGDDVFVVYVETKKTLRKTRMINRGDDLELIEKRLNNDNNIFKKKNINKIDLVLKNKNQPLEDLAKEVDNKYLTYKLNHKREEQEKVYTTKVMFAQLPVFILTLLIRVALGYRSIIYFDIDYIVLIYTILIVYKYFKKSNFLFKILEKLFVFLALITIVLPGFEYKGPFITFLAEITYILPLIIMLIMFYLKSKIK